MYNHSVTYREDELPMPAVTPLCRAQLVPNSFAMCRSAAHARNSFRFCTYKITSYLHIPQPLELMCLQGPARISDLTLLPCADTKSRGVPTRANRGRRSGARSVPNTSHRIPPAETPMLRDQSRVTSPQ